MRPIDAIVSRVLQREGGIGTDPIDRGGRTAFGQTEDWLEEFGLSEPKTVEQAAANYLSWLSMTKLDRLCTVDDALANVTIDSAVNAGTYAGIEAMQRALKVKADGAIGPVTLAALAMCDRGTVAAKVWGEHFGACVENVLHDALLLPLVPKTQLKFLRGHANRLRAQVTRL